MIINRIYIKIKLTSDKVAIEDLQPLKERFALKTILLKLTILFSKENKKPSIQ
jgi:hypothetical protein